MTTRPGQQRRREATLVRRMLGYLRPYVLHMAGSIGLVIVMVVCTNLLPVVVQRVIDEVLTDASTRPPPVNGRILWQAAGLYTGLAAAVFVLRFLQTYIMSWVGQHVIYDLRAAIFKKVVGLPFAFYDRHPVGRLMTRVTSDVASMQKALTDGVVSLVADVFALVGIMGFMLYLSPRLALVIFVAMPVLFAVMVFINLGIRAAHRAVRAEQSNVNAFLQEMVTGMSTVQLFNREEDARTRFAEANGRLHEAYIRSVHWFSFFFPSIEVLGAATTALLLVVGGWMMLNGSPGVSAGVLVAFLMYIRDFFRPMEDLSEKSNNLQAALASGEKLFTLLDTPAVLRDPDQPEVLAGFRGEVAFENVSFAYHDEEWVLRDVNLKIDPGESVAVVGATGAGKTSVISLLARFYDVQKGSVRLDGHDVRSLRQVDLRRRIGIVLQDPFLFSGTIRDNISLGNPDLTPAEVERAARYVNADPFVRALPKGYDTEIHERGVELSTGQKQLVALARALAQNPDILLILDEATANVDTETELLIQDAMKKLMHGRTSIVIAHRLSTIQHVDRIYVMRKGTIVESGSHRELLEHGGYYKRLYELLTHGG